MDVYIQIYIYIHSRLGVRIVRLGARQAPFVLSICAYRWLSLDACKRAFSERPVR